MPRTERLDLRRAALRKGVHGRAGVGSSTSCARGSSLPHAPETSVWTGGERLNSSPCAVIIEDRKALTESIASLYEAREPPGGVHTSSSSPKEWSSTEDDLLLAGSNSEAIDLMDVSMGIGSEDDGASDSETESSVGGRTTVVDGPPGLQLSHPGGRE